MCVLVSHFTVSASQGSSIGPSFRCAQNDVRHGSVIFMKWCVIILTQICVNVFKWWVTVSDGGCVMVYKWVTHIGTMTHHSRGSRGASYKWHLHNLCIVLNYQTFWFTEKVLIQRNVRSKNIHVVSIILSNTYLCICKKKNNNNNDLTECKHINSKTIQNNNLDISDVTMQTV